MFNLSGKNAVITGAGSGIGRAVALLFGKQGAAVHVVDISEENANHAAAEIIENGGQAFPYTCDVTNQSQVVEIYNQLLIVLVRIHPLSSCSNGKPHG